jgi:hypothetical protein
MNSRSEGLMHALPAMAAAVLLIASSGCSSWRSGSSTRSGDSGSSTQSGAAASPTRTMSEPQVRQDLNNHGYSNVSGLRQSGSDWTGTAVDGSGKPVNFDVDEQGVIVIIP